MVAALSVVSDTPDPTPAELIAARPHLRMHAMDGLLLDDVPLQSIADAVGTPCWVYSAATMRARAQSLAGALARCRAGGAAALCGEGQRPPRGAAPVRRTGCRRRRGQRGRTPARPRRRHSCRTHRVLRRRQVGARTPPRAGRGYRPDQRRKRRGAGDALRPGCLARPHRPGRAAGEPGRRCRHACQDRHRPGARQVRHPLCRCRRTVCPRCRTARYPAGRAGDPYRQPDTGAGALSRCVRPHCRSGPRAARCRPYGRHGGLRRRPRHSVPQ